jgi:hypothetical protein
VHERRAPESEGVLRQHSSVAGAPRRQLLQRPESPMRSPLRGDLLCRLRSHRAGIKLKRVWNTQDQIILILCGPTIRPNALTGEMSCWTTLFPLPLPSTADGS